jgi:hypothetical protein
MVPDHRLIAAGTPRVCRVAPPPRHEPACSSLGQTAVQSLHTAAAAAVLHCRCPLKTALLHRCWCCHAVVTTSRSKGSHTLSQNQHLYVWLAHGAHAGRTSTHTMSSRLYTRCMRMLSVVRRPHPAQVLRGCYRLARCLLVPFGCLG